jgi:hypothetical protein
LPAAGLVANVEKKETLQIVVNALTADALEEYNTSIRLPERLEI